MAILFPKINLNEANGLEFVQKGCQYGVNDTGPWQRYSVKGTNAAVENLAALLMNAGWTVTVTRDIVVDDSGSGDTGFNGATADYGLSTVEAQAGWQFPQTYGTETPEDIWEMEPQDDQIDLCSANMPYAEISPLSADYNIKSTKQCISEMIDSNFPFAWNDALSIASSPPAQGNQQYIFDGGVNATNADGTLTTPSKVHLPTTDYASAKAFYFLLKNGFTDYPSTAPIIRHSLVTSNVYAVQAAYNNALRIISSASMYSIEGVPNNLLFAVPSAPDATLFIEYSGDLQYGWRKPWPAITRLNRWKWRIQQNYIYGCWPVQIFGQPL